MKKSRTLIHFLLTIIVVTGLIVFINPSKLFNELTIVNWFWFILAFCLAPVYIFLRFYKWVLLEKQVVASSKLKEIIPKYLWGMALGLITPGKIGELWKVRSKKISINGAGLFFLEKIIEIICLFSLCLISILFLDFIKWWVIVIFMFGTIPVIICWRKIAIKFLYLIHRIISYPSLELLESISWAILNIKVRGTLLLSYFVSILFIFQAYFILLSYGIAANLNILLLFPLIFLANLIPITIGNYGLRELFSVLILSQQNISESKAVACVAIVTFFNIVVPGIIGWLWHNLKKIKLKNQ